MRSDTVTASERALASSMRALASAVASAFPHGPPDQVSNTLDSRSSCTLTRSEAASSRSTTAGSGW